jgi:predicted transcriptional regulator of viral defense system
VHRLGTQIPSAVWIAVDRAKTHSRPRIHHLNVEYVWFSGPAFTEGRERHQIHGVNVQVYSAAKTVADLFKYRHKIGEDVAIEALREGLRERRFSPAQLEYFARVCRVWSVIQPYMKGVIG